jgi:hypothetical protein
MDLYSRPDPKAAEGAGKSPGQEEEGDVKGPDKREQDEEEERVRGTRRHTGTGNRSNPPRKTQESRIVSIL